MNDAQRLTHAVLGTVAHYFERDKRIRRTDLLGAMERHGIALGTSEAVVEALVSRKQLVMDGEELRFASVLSYMAFWKIHRPPGVRTSGFTMHFSEGPKPKQEKWGPIIIDDAESFQELRDEQFRKNVMGDWA